MTRKRRWGAAIGAAVVVVVAGASVAAWLLFGGDEPPPAALTTLPTSASSAAPSNDSPDGTWTIDGASGSLADGSSTYAGYRVSKRSSPGSARTPRSGGRRTCPAP